MLSSPIHASRPRSTCIYLQCHNKGMNAKPDSVLADPTHHSYWASAQAPQKSTPSWTISGTWQEKLHCRIPLRGFPRMTCSVQGRIKGFYEQKYIHGSRWFFKPLDYFTARAPHQIALFSPVNGPLAKELLFLWNNQVLGIEVKKRNPHIEQSGCRQLSGTTTRLVCSNWVTGYGRIILYFPSLHPDTLSAHWRMDLDACHLSAGWEIPSSTKEKFLLILCPYRAWQIVASNAKKDIS